MLLERFGQWVVYDLLHVAHGRLGGSLEFFIVDTIKVFILLAVFVFLIGVIRTFLSFDRLRQWIGRQSLFAHFMAAVFGAVTPFCSCSSIPIFFSFLKSGIPLGVMFTFLVSSPIIDQYIVVLMVGFFGWKIAVAYVVGGMIMGMAAGMVLERMRLERYLVSDFTAAEQAAFPDFPTFADRLRFGVRETKEIVGKVWIWILVGIAIGAVIHNYVPQETVQGLMAKTGPFSVPIAVLLGIPLYASCAAIVPIALVLFQKGIPLGTALAFMMAMSALSLPEAVMLRRALKLPLILIFFAVTTLGIVLTGYLINALQPLLVQ